MEQDEVGTLAALKARRKEVLEPLVAKHQGRVFKVTGDGVLVEFASAVNAVQCAVELQKSMAAANDGIAADRLIELRVGINLGDVVVEGGDLYGEGINVAARLEALSDPGSLCISGSVLEHVNGKVPFAFARIGPQTLKNIDRPIQVYRLERTEVPRTSAPIIGPILPEKPSIAVLPFTNMSGDQEQEYFADGITEDITTALARMKWLFVIARNSSFTYKGRIVDAKQIGRDLGVRYILEGSVRKSSSRLRITGQLIEAETGTHIWAERFDGGAEDVFDLQDQITEAVAAAIEPRLRTAEMERAQRKRPDKLSAYDLFLRALSHFYPATREEHAEAIQLLTQAMQIDPAYAPPYALAAQCYVYKVVQGWSDDVTTDRAEGARLAYAAVERDRDDPTVLWMAGHAIGRFTDDHRTSLSLLGKATKLNPSSASAWCWSGWGHVYVDEWTTVIEHFRAALRLSPVDRTIFVFKSGMALAYLIGERYDEAIRWANDSIREHPTWTSAHRVLISCLAHQGRMTEVKEACLVLLSHEPNYRLSQSLALSPSPAPGYRRYLEGLRKAGLPE